MSTFRLATVNVHSFRNPSTFTKSTTDLASIFHQYNLDLIAVQEIQNNHYWTNFCSDLSLPYSIYGSACGEFFGNGFASRYPISFHSNQQSDLSMLNEQRALLHCRLHSDHSFIENRIFAVTHLDHINEDERLKQIQQFNPIQHHIDILLGDMNALTKDDYSDEYYQENILQKRQKFHWEIPRFDLTKLITQEWGYQDAFKLINPNKKDHEVVTCRYQTRIDYIYLHPRINDQWILKQCSIIDTQGLTDHQAVFAEFQLKSE